MSDSLRRRRATRRWSASTPTTSQPGLGEGDRERQPDVPQANDPYLHRGQG